MRGQKPATPQNLAARALRETLFRQRKLKNAKTYSRKVKHKKEERDAVGVPLFVCLGDAQGSIQLEIS